MKSVETVELVNQADIYLDAGDLHLAKQTFERVCEINAQHAEAWMMIGVIDIDLGDLNAAEKNIRKAIEIDENYPDAHYFLSTVLLKRNEIHGAYELCKRAVDLDPDFTEAKNMLAALSSECSGVEDEDAGDTCQSLIASGSRLYKEGDMDAAYSKLREALDIAPENADIWRMCGEISLHLHNYEDARLCLMKAIEYTPDNAYLHLKLAQCLSALGDIEAAIASCREAVRIQPGFIDGLMEMARYLVNKGDYSGSIRIYEEVLGIDAGNVPAINNIGKLYLFFINDPQKSLDYFNMSIAVDASNASAHHGAANALFSLGYINEAIDAMRAATELAPDRIEYLNNLAAFYRFAGHLDDALNIYERVVNIDGGNQEAQAGKAEILQRMRRYAESYDIVRSCMSAGIRNANLAIVYSNICRHFGECHSAIKLIEDIFELDNPAPDAKRPLHYALGRLHDADSRYDQAFEQYEAANRLDDRSYDAESHAAYIRAIIDSTSEGAFSISDSSGSDCSRPVFIIGMPRSGTSLVEQILATHPDVFGAGELDTVSRIVSELTSSGSVADVYPYCLSSSQPSDYKSLGDAYCDVIRDIEPDAKLVTDKMPENYLHLGLIYRMLPDSTIIHCTRNPLDTCLSIYFQAFADVHHYSSDLIYIGRRYIEYDRIMKHWKSILTAERVLEISYEDLVTDLEGGAKRMLSHCGLDWTNDCLQFYDTERVVATASYDQVRQPVYTQSVGRWKHYRTQLQPLIDCLASAGIHPE